MPNFVMRGSAFLATVSILVLLLSAASSAASGDKTPQSWRTKMVVGKYTRSTHKFRRYWCQLMSVKKSHLNRPATKLVIGKRLRSKIEFLPPSCFLTLPSLSAFVAMRPSAASQPAKSAFGQQHSFYGHPWVSTKSEWPRVASRVWV